MLTLTSRKSLIIWIVVISVIVLLLILPIKLNYTLYVKGKILPVKEWIIYKGTDGRLTSLLTNYKTGINQSYDVTLFDRGDAMKFTFNDALRSGTQINADDTIAIVYSNEIERQIENLKGEVVSAKASLVLNATGEKESIINQEKKNLEYAIRQTAEQKKILDRTETLYNKGLVSQEEYDIVKGSYDLNEINIAISKARLEAVETGVKKEQIGLIKSQIIFLEKELDVMQKRFKGFTIISPINGTVSRKTNSDTLMIISDVSEFILINPVKVNDKKYISDSAQVDVLINQTGEKIKANVYEIDNSVQIINGIQVVTVTSKINGNNKDLYPSLMVDCYIHTGSLSPLQYLFRVWNRMVN